MHLKFSIIINFNVVFKDIIVLTVQIRLDVHNELYIERRKVVYNAMVFFFKT